MLKIFNPESIYRTKGSDQGPKTEFDPQNEYDFKLDNFQKFAIEGIYNNENVLVTAKTGSGKTLVAEYQIRNTLRKNKRVFYCNPIKSLSNQKFHDLKKLFGADKVGIITGDIKFQPQADILIMTTEILRNLLYKENSKTKEYGLTAGVSLEDLDAVIFDEVHYINDPDRGKVWEETLILLNKDINLVLLSATIGNAEEFGQWLVNIKEKTLNLIMTKHRVVPLTHCITDENYNFIDVMNNESIFNDENYNRWLKNKNEEYKKYKTFKETVKNREEGQVITDKHHIISFERRLNLLVVKLKEKELLPALFFIFSRKDCERYAKIIEEPLIDSSDAANVKHIINHHLHHYKDRIETLQQYHTLVDLLVKGVAFHHSGLIPILKEIVEILFSMGYIKVMFATETFAVGINMPTKTVVFLDYKKYDEQKEDLRLIRHDEYMQMAGRAGRRGIDTKGLVIYFPFRSPVSKDEKKLILKGKLNELESRMDFSYDFLLKILNSNKYTYEQILTSSYYTYQMKDFVEHVKKENILILNKQKSLNLDNYIHDLHFKHELDKMVKTKEVQKQVSLWNNKHIGPTWNNAIQKYSEWLKYQNEIERNDNKIKECDIKGKSIQLNLNYLNSLGYIDIENFHGLDMIRLTKKGVLATEINEVNSLLLIEVYQKGFFKTLSTEEIVGLISVFQDSNRSIEIENNVSDNLYKIYKEILNIKEFLKSKEMILSKEAYWSTTLDYVNPMIMWCRGEASQLICQQYNIFPGNLCRIITSVSNTLEELITISTIENNVEMLKKLNDIKPLLIRDIAIPESLYLRN
jgi:superfamily II RNA helicase